jgi:hypothetical protein
MTNFEGGEVMQAINQGDDAELHNRAAAKLIQIK